ncbi:tRNA lysidine(34) synthetase TilS [Tessaracoccus antarcticus]|uniref:tRNA(Ile)-lysidine synthase n=1 Tax=Tessaracoccus antarcticus TaxID=2479848 RepID=A0A3M0GA70_9ACTN|nr:tRNA lysidine(34) synthetase TilS [Tessaracoccus antarcticus]RMB61167.1 tRNA lysidine(34) synthetase TilS [Tessaracoccus antarcticus]
MARRELGPASLEVARAVAAMLPAGPVVVGCSGGADSLALALGATWAAARNGSDVTCVVVDHGLQDGSDDVALRVVATLRRAGLSAESRRVQVAEGAPGGMESAARDARLETLASDGHPVLLGHTLDDQAESVLLGLLRGSGTRSLSGMAPVRGPFVRPLLGLRRSTTVQACREWGVEPWQDPHNDDPRFRRVRARNHLEGLAAGLGSDVAPALARSATLARMDADLLDELAVEAAEGWDTSDGLLVADVAPLPAALRLRALRNWVLSHGVAHPGMVHLLAVDALVTSWRGQGPVHLPRGLVERRGDRLRITAR